MKKILFIATILLVSSQAFAASTPCTQANMVGNYVMYQAALIIIITWVVAPSISLPAAL